MSQFFDDHRLARELAQRTGAALLALQRSGEFEGSDLKDRADRLANQILTEGLRAQRPGDPVLSEEEADDLERIGHDRVWIIDPLDGTREFAEPGRKDWAVHVALAIDGEPVVGAVALPAFGKVLSTDRVPEPPPTVASQIEVLVSRTRPPELAQWLAKDLGWKLVSMGSAGAKAMAILRGEGNLYLHAGGQYEWDSCAPVAVALAAGFHASRLDGSRLRYNQPDPYLPDLLLCRPELSEMVLAAIASYSGARKEINATDRH